MREAAARRVLLLGGLALAVAVAWLLLRVRDVLTPFILAGVLAYLAAPLVERLHRRGLARPWAILVTYALAGLLLGGVLAVVVPDLVRELGRLGQLLPVYAAKADAAMRGLRAGGRGRLPEPVVRALEAGVAALQARGEAAIRSATAGVLSVIGGLVSIVLAPFLAYYLLVDLPRIRAAVLGVVPPASRPALLAYLRDLDAMLAGFVRGQLLTAASVGLLVTVAMSLLHVGYAVTLGLIAGLGELVPYFGPFLGAVPALALAGSISWHTLLYAALALAVIQQLESAVIHPYIVGQSTGLHPLTVVFALLAGGQLVGLAGLILGVPAAGAVQVTVTHLVRAVVSWRRGGREAAPELRPLGAARPPAVPPPRLAAAAERGDGGADGARQR
jgi:predicted PurR-regulated permease PerM